MYLDITLYGFYLYTGCIYPGVYIYTPGYNRILDYPVSISIYLDMTQPRKNTDTNYLVIVNINLIKYIKIKSYFFNYNIHH